MKYAVKHQPVPYKFQDAMKTFLQEIPPYMFPHHLIRSGEKVPTAEPGGSHEGEGSHRGGEE